MIGILGGMGTQAGLDFCNKLAKLNRGKLDQQYPMFVLYNKSNTPRRPENLKRYNEALQEYDFQIEISNRSGDQEGVGSAFANKCNIYKKLGDYDEAVACSKKAYDIYSNMDAKHTHCSTFI